MIILFKRVLLLSCPFSVIVITLFCLADRSSAETLVMAGSGTNMAATNLLIKGFLKRHPGVSIPPPTNIGSGGAIQATADGAISLGLISRPLKEREKKYALTVLPLAVTAIVFATNPGVPDDGITSEEVVNIYNGVKSRWKNGTNILVLTREEGESSIELLKEKIPGFRRAYEESIKVQRWTVLMKLETMNSALVKTGGAFGISDMSAITAYRLQIKPLKFDGVVATPANIASGKYPLSKQLAFVCRPDRITPALKAFIDFSRSAEGRAILKKAGYVVR